MAGVTSPTAGTRVEPIDSYKFIRGTTATFKTTFLSDGKPTTVDVGTFPIARVLEPMFLNKSGSTTPIILATLQGSLVSGQQYEYEFVWEIPANFTQLDEYVVSYSGTVGGVTFNFGDEYFTVLSGPGQIGLKTTGYATISDIRMMKFNIDSYLPNSISNDLNARNAIIEFHLNNATTKLREELNLHRARGNTENYRLFCIYYTVWSILLASRGEDGSSVSDQNIQFWRSEWNRVLDHEKRRSAFQGISFGRS